MNVVIIRELFDPTNGKLVYQNQQTVPINAEAGESVTFDFTRLEGEMNTYKLIGTIQPVSGPQS